MLDGAISGLARHAAGRFGGQPAVMETGGDWHSFNDIDRAAGRFAGSLKALGVRKGNRIVLYLPNGVAWVVAYHAIARLGAVVIPANILLSPEEVRYQACHSDASYIIVPANRADQIGRDGARLICRADTDCPVGGDDIDFATLLEGAYEEPVACSPDDLLAIGYTSGTTGNPKGAMLTHGNVFASTAGTATIHVRHDHDIILSSLPLPHVYGNVVMNSCFLTGARLITAARFDPADSIRLIEAHRVTLFEGVPTMYYQLLGRPELETADFSSLTRCTVGGQTMPIAKLDLIVEKLGCPLLELWGMTEVAGPAISHSPYWPSRHGSIGLPVCGIEARVVDMNDPDRPAPAGQAGELQVRGPLVTAGYWKDEGATSAAIGTGGWLATGDIATMDADGFFFIVDRKKDLIITAGYNVYPAELEQVIARHPSVAMVAVGSVPDDEKGELAHAYVVRHKDDLTPAQDIVSFCRNNLAAYKVPRAIHFVEDLPKTSTGKIMRRALKEAASTQESMQ